MTLRLTEEMRTLAQGLYKFAAAIPTSVWLHVSHFQCHVIDYEDDQCLLKFKLFPFKKMKSNKALYISCM